MKPTERSDGRWTVFIPRKLSESGKREAKYFPSKTQAAKFVAEFKSEHREHGKSGVTSQQREWIRFAESKLGNLALLPEVIRHWELTGATLSKIRVADACDRYLKDRASETDNKRSMNDVKWRILAFKSAFPGRELHELTAGHIEEFLKSISKGWESSRIR